MDETKVAGVIGQRYSDRRTGKTGVLIDRNEKFKTLLFEADDGSTFNICYSTFRSQWRKESMEQPTIITDASDKIEETEIDTVSAESDDVKNAEDIEEEMFDTDNSDTGAFEAFIDRVKIFRNITGETTCEGSAIIAATLAVDGFIIFSITRVDNHIYQMRMIPDVDLYTDWGKVFTDQFSIDSHAPDQLIIKLRALNTSLPEILSAIEPSVKDINLYGYVEESNNESN